jgi:N utilization substance protein B
MPVENRHFARELVLQTIFEWEFRGGEPKIILERLLVEFADLKADAKFAKKLLAQVLEHLPEVKNKITRHASKWEIEKIAAVERACLYIGLTELLYDPKIPAKVALNESVELAKDFGADWKFVNAIAAKAGEDGH